MADHQDSKGSPSRLDHQPPRAVSEWGWRYHHLGIPTSEPRAGEIYLEEHRFFVSGFQESPFGIEWMRFEDDSTVSALIQTVPHLAFEVDDLDEALAGKEVLLEPTELYPGAKVAMILSDGAPVELLQFRCLETSEGQDLDGDGSVG